MRSLAIVSVVFLSFVACGGNDKPPENSGGGARVVPEQDGGGDMTKIDEAANRKSVV